MAKPLTIRKLADTSGGERVKMFDERTGQPKLVNPATPGTEHEPWPLAGVQIMGEIPDEVTVPTSWVDRGVTEGWLELVNPRTVVRPAGPRQSVLNSTTNGGPHVFVHADAIVVKTLAGDVRYRVAHQPDKYADPGDDTTPVTPDVYDGGNTRVDHFYRLVLEA